MKGKLVRIRIFEDTVLDFNTISKGQGVYHLSISNKGSSTAIIDDVTQEELAPKEIFVVESPIPIINREFSIKFKEESDKQNNLIISYIVPVNECY